MFSCLAKPKRNENLISLSKEEFYKYTHNLNNAYILSDMSGPVPEKVQYVICCKNTLSKQDFRNIENKGKAKRLDVYLLNELTTIDLADNVLKNLRIITREKTKIIWK